ncbi:MAG: PKD domain-containing protein [Candidatus Wildermuthbacteria bacterium]|nr:PKD domain-containing protein [Candidatus Wildermuthbacteria bacterium]
MKHLQPRKKFVVALLVAIAIMGIFVFFLSQDFFITYSVPPPAPLTPKQGDRNPPALFIDSPFNGTWQRDTFSAVVFEEDLGVGLNESSCVYQVCAYGKSGEERCSGFVARSCNSATSEITVGANRMCSFEGRDSCSVFVEANDRLGNKGMAYASYHIDFTPPEFGEIVVREEIENYMVEARVRDDAGILGCGIYINDIFIKMADFVDDCETECRVVGSFKPDEERPQVLKMRCADTARNNADSRPVVVAVNGPPHIVSCSVYPFEGTTDILFRYVVDATDLDGDLLTYLWEFEDGTTANSKEVSRAYSRAGTYRPSVAVTDPSGRSDTCFPVWVVVE